MRENRNNPAILAPVYKSIFVDLPIENAFQLFTAGFGGWWPLATHSTGEEHAIDCILEGRAGGRIYEILKDGRQVDWGLILNWDAPHTLIFSWHPGRPPETAQQVEVTFRPEGSGTRVELMHTGWERLGDRAQVLHEEYDRGWDFVLGQYVQHASTAGKTSLSKAIPPLIQSVLVSLPVEAAFRLFTQGMCRWWPLVTHSVGGDMVETCVLESRVGGRFYEIQADGSQAEWGKVLTWEPPHRLAFTLHPGMPPETAGDVEITFRQEAGGTRVNLTHSGWERCGEGAQAMRAGYARGWEHILARYRAEAGSQP